MMMIILVFYIELPRQGAAATVYRGHLPRFGQVAVKRFHQAPAGRGSGVSAGEMVDLHRFTSIYESFWSIIGRLSSISKTFLRWNGL